MKSALLVVLLAAAATAAVVSNEVPDVVRVPDVMGPDGVEEHDVADLDDVADMDVFEMPEMFVTEQDELIDADELIDEDEELQTAVASRRNLSAGTIGARDVLLFNGEYRVNGIAGRIQERTIRVTTNRRISAVRVNRVGASQNATPSIVGGGIGSSSITIRIRSAAGRGYHYRVLIYVR